MQDAQSIIIGIASGFGGALAAVTAFLIAFRSLEKSVESAVKRIKHVEDRLTEEVKAIDTCLSRKIDQTACDQCHKAFETELARGGKHFVELFESHKMATKMLGEMHTTLQVLIQRTSAMEATLGRVTRVEVRLPNDSEQA